MAVIEFGGAYDAERVRVFHEDCVPRALPYQLLGSVSILCELGTRVPVPSQSELQRTGRDGIATYDERVPYQLW